MLLRHDRTRYAVTTACTFRDQTELNLHLGESTQVCRSIAIRVSRFAANKVRHTGTLKAKFEDLDIDKISITIVVIVIR